LREQNVRETWGDSGQLSGEEKREKPRRREKDICACLQLFRNTFKDWGKRKAMSVSKARPNFRQKAALKHETEKVKRGAEGVIRIRQLGQVPRVRKRQKKTGREKLCRFGRESLRRFNKKRSGKNENRRVRWRKRSYAKIIYADNTNMRLRTKIIVQKKKKETGVKA